MNIKKKFLKLPIIHQITLVIIVNIIMCLITILGIFAIYSNIILNIRIRKRKEYIFHKYKETIDSEIHFQTFLLYQYEQLIKAFNTHMYYHGLSQKDLYDTVILYKENSVKHYTETTEEEYNENIKNGINIYYLLSYSNEPFINGYFFFLLSNTYSSMDNILKVLRNLRIPYFGDIQLINEYNFAALSQQSLYSANRTRIKEIEENSGGNIIKYYDDLINNFVNEYRIFLNAYKNKELFFTDIFFKNIYDVFSNYTNKTFIKDNYQNNIRNYLNNISHYFSYINYSTEKTFITDNGDVSQVNFLEQNTIISDYINKIFFIIHNRININVVPVFSKNNTIMSINLCYFLLYKQMIFLNLTSDKNIFDENLLNDIYKQLEKGDTNIGSCILDKKYNFNNKHNAYDILNIKFNKFYSIKNIREFSLFQISKTFLGESFFYEKYTFPDFSSILNYNPTFLTLEQLNLYCFKSFYEPKHYEENLITFFENCQYLLILCLTYLWLIIFFFVFYKLKKLSTEIIDPINNLTKVIDKFDIKKENLLKYEADDSIDELFQLCNDLLLGKYKQKMMHENLDNELNENIQKINDFSNLKINRKLIEEMIENKNEYKIKDNEIMKFTINDNIFNKKNIINDNIKTRNEVRKTTIVNRKFVATTSKNGLNIINDIEQRVKKTSSIDHTISILNKKLSYDVNLMDHSNKAGNNDEDILEIEILLNYKQLFDIIDLTYNYDFKYNRKFISKNSKLIFRTNSKFGKSSMRKISFSKSSVRSRSIHERKDIFKDTFKDTFKDFKDNEREEEIKANLKIKIEDFNKSVINSYETNDILFLWYKEAKFFHRVEFLQNNHNKELNNLCNLNLNIWNEKKLSDKQIYNSKTLNNKKVSSILKKANK